MSMSVLPGCIYLHHMHAIPAEAKGDGRCHGFGITHYVSRLKAPGNQTPVLYKSS